MNILAMHGGLVALIAITATASSPAAARGEPGTVAQPSSLLPKMAGWKISDGPTTYTPETLFEYIDGGADLFLQFDFQDLTSATYVNDGVGNDKHRKLSRGSHDSDPSATTRVEITVDIYRHKDAIRAFGVYTQERPAATTPLPIGVEGYAAQDHLEFVVGSYYVKLVQLGSKQMSLLRPFAEKLATSLPGTREPPAVLKVFPERGKLVRAEKLTARDFLGQPFLHNAVAVPYQIAGANFRLFVVEGKDSADVRSMVLRYRSLAKLSAAGADSVGTQGSTTVKDPLNGEVLLQWKGRWLWGAVDQTCAERQALVDELGRNLSGLDK
jgi:hypothetical protein